MQFKYLKECDGGELIRLNVGDTPGAWAIVVRVQNSSEILVVRLHTGDQPPELLELFRETNFVERSHDLMPILSFGKDYVFEPDLTGLCDVGSEASEEVAGLLVMSDERVLLGAKSPDKFRDKVTYIEVANGLMSSPGVSKLASFGSWKISLRKADEPMISVASFSTV